MAPGKIDELTHTTSLGTWRLTRAEPCAELAGIVHEYWEVQGRLSPFREAVLPNGYVEVMVNLGPAHRVFEGTGTGVWDTSWFSGLQERSIFIESLDGTHLASIRMHPLGATQIFGFATSSAANSIVDLDTLVGADAHDLRESLIAAQSPSARFATLESFVRGRITQSIAIPTFVREAADRIERTHGCLRVAELHEELDVSRKHLAVSFSRYVGVSAKAYARIQRFVWTVERLGASTDVEWSRIAAEAGYSDQSHLVRDFRRIGAASPTEYLRRFAPDRDALLETAG
ncbi:MAG: helix-turn-helix domain-containing protein [Gemmatimonadaceae bacterium]